jgi:CBS domain-containing protein
MGCTWSQEMLVSHILKDKGNGVVAIPPYATLHEASQILMSNRIGALIVLKRDGCLDGIISERDIVRACAEHGEEALTRTVGAQMNKDVAA